MVRTVKYGMYQNMIYSLLNHLKSKKTFDIMTESLRMLEFEQSKGQRNLAEAKAVIEENAGVSALEQLSGEDALRKAAELSEIILQKFDPYAPQLNQDLGLAMDKTVRAYDLMICRTLANGEKLVVSVYVTRSLFGIESSMAVAQFSNDETQAPQYAVTNQFETQKQRFEAYIAPKNLRISSRNAWSESAFSDIWVKLYTEVSLPSLIHCWASRATLSTRIVAKNDSWG